MISNYKKLKLLREAFKCLLYIIIIIKRFKGLNMIQQQILSLTHKRQDMFVLRDKKSFSDLYFSDLLELELYLLDYIENNEYFLRYEVINNQNCKYYKDVIKSYLIYDNNDRLIIEYIIYKDYLFLDRK